MNVDDRESSTVTSKYFATKTAMDESLSDFQETKKSSAGPKNTVKTRSNKPRKAPKRIRGQKDIRTALRSKELELYSKDFDKVCKKAGIDVDPEQLQLAIALSKSLQDQASTSNKDTSTQQTSTHERISKIRTTLQEYGFKVPEIKIGLNRRQKKLRKNYKLISTSDDEKEQIIVNRYSQVLFENIAQRNIGSSDACNIRLYHLATNITYDILKVTETLYVENLIEKSSNPGNLLRDWSEIPGRPVSPKLFEPADMNFSEVECSQDELDIVLSGSLKSCKNVISSKRIQLVGVHDPKLVEDINSNAEGDFHKHNINLNSVKETLSRNQDKILQQTITPTQNTIEIITQKQCRSCSPDIFDDEVSILDDSTDCTTPEEIKISIHSTAVTNIEFMDLTECECVQQNYLKPHQSIHEKPIETLLQNDVTKRKSNDLMELRECNHIQPTSLHLRSCVKLNSHLSQNINVTKRMSNDFMEITECVATLSQTVVNKQNVDLSQSPDFIIGESLNKTSREYTNIHKQDNPSPSLAKDIERMSNVATSNNIDLTQSPEKEYDSQILKKKEEDADESIQIEVDKSVVSMDLTQSSNTSDELPYVSLTAAKDNSYSDDTILIEVNEFSRFVTEPVQNNDVLDLTQRKNIVSNNDIHSQSFFDEYVHNHSDNNEELTDGIMNKNSSNTQIESGMIDLTGSPEEIGNTKSNKIRDNDIFKHADNILKPVERSPYDSVSKDHLGSSYFKNVDKSNMDAQELLSFRQSQQGEVDLTESPEDPPNPDNKDSNKNIDSEEVTINNYKVRSTENASKYRYNNSCTQKSEADEVDLTGSLDRKANPSKEYASDIDLTQKSDSSLEENHASNKRENSSSTAVMETKENNDFDKTVSYHNDLQADKSSKRCSSLGKKDDVSIDYDELYYSKAIEQVEPNDVNEYIFTNKSVIYETPDVNIDDNSNNNVLSNCSQNSEVFEISDKELDYSLQKSKLERPVDNFDFGGISIMDELSNAGSFRKSSRKNSINENSVINIRCADSVNNLDGGTANIANENLPKANIKCNKNFFYENPSRNKEISAIRPEKSNKGISPIKHRRITEISTPQKASTSNLVQTVTPNNSEVVIKTNGVTPMLDYESMSTPEIHVELDKYGIKPFKRKRAIQLLTHIYNQTHPIIETYSGDLASPCKRHKLNDDPSTTPPKRISPKRLLATPEKVRENLADRDYVKTNEIDKGIEQSSTKVSEISKSKNIRKGVSDKEEDGAVNIGAEISPRKDPERSKGKNNARNRGSAKERVENVEMEKSPRKVLNYKSKESNSRKRSNDKESDDIINYGIEANRNNEEVYEVTGEIPVIKDVECRPEDWVFQKREKAKIHSCRVPLHIAFHNYVSSRRDLREAILCYEPINIDIVHKDLVSYGHRYDSKDLLKFMDKKCITVKTTDNDARNAKR